MSGFHLDPDALRAVTDGLADAATTFDDAGQGVPTSADGGLAAGLVADILRTVGDAGEQLTTDAATLASDLIVVAATGDGAAAVLRGASPEDLQRMSAQADRFGAQRLSRTADVVVAALDEMTGATSPRLQLELMCARVLALAAAAPAASPAPAR